MPSHTLRPVVATLLALVAPLAPLAPLATLAPVALVAPVASAHEFRAGSVRIEHPYALATVPGQKNGAVYFRTLTNAGDADDQLVGARAGVSARVEIHRVQVDAGVMRMRSVGEVPLPPRAVAPMRHGGGDNYHLMLVDLKKPLADGERFPVVLQFRNAGEREVTVVVQRPVVAGSATTHGHH